jgi:predicted acylesterase/phospholipase RssA
MYASVASEPTGSPSGTSTPQSEAGLISLALQDGGAHGATWGVLDRLIEDHRIGFDRISATWRRRNEGDSLMITWRIR